MTEEEKSGEEGQQKQEMNPSTRMLVAMCGYATRVFESDAPTSTDVELALRVASVACGQMRTRTLPWELSSARRQGRQA